MSGLTLPQKVTRWLIIQKARGQAGFATALPLLVSTRFQVLFHSPYWGSFHLSLTVLVHYRSPEVFSLGQWAARLPTGLACPVVLRITNGSLPPFAYGTITPSGPPFQYGSAREQVCNFLGVSWSSLSGPTTPITQRPRPWHVISLGFSPFARHYSGNNLFS